MRLPTHAAEARLRFAAAGPAGLSDREHLAALIWRLDRRCNADRIATTLVERFGSFAEAIHAPAVLLREAGVGSELIHDLRLVAAVPQRVLRGRLVRRRLIGSWTQVLDYCRAAMAFEPREQFRILFLDKKNQLIGDQVQQVGTVDHTPVYPREVLRRAIELSATAIVLVHNHPSGDPTPSRADVEMTKAIVEALRPLGIAVHDHIVIGRNGHASLKDLELI